MDVNSFLDQVWPHVLQAARHFSSTVAGDLGKASANLGERLLARLILRRGDDRQDHELATAARDVEDNPADVDFENALRGKLKKALYDAGLDLQAEFVSDLAASPSSAGDRSVTGIVVRSTVITGDRNHIR